MIKHILLTGNPRTGKTTILKELIKDLDSCGGFYSEEMVKNNERMGFRIKTLAGEEGILAEKGLRSKYRLGKYGINIKDLEEIGVKAIEKALKEKNFIVIDEIGKMEFFSEKFRKIVFEAFNSSKHVLGVVHKDMRNLFASREDTEVLEVELNNHQDILKRCRILLKGEKN